MSAQADPKKRVRRSRHQPAASDGAEEYVGMLEATTMPVLDMRGEGLDAFLALWLPFEMEIGRMTGALQPTLQITELEDEEGEPSDDEERAQRWREIRRGELEKVIECANLGDELALRVLQALEPVMQMFAQCVLSVPQSENTAGKIADSGKQKPSAVMNHDAISSSAKLSPGALVLRELTDDAEFLRRATAYSSALHLWLIRFSAAAVQAASQPNLPAMRTQTLPEITRFFNDPIHSASVRCMAQVDQWKPMDDLAYAFQNGSAKTGVVMGLPQSDGAKSLWESLCHGGARMVKAHYALWARYYEDVDQKGQRYVIVSVPQFCADIGLKKHHKGGYRAEQKDEALQLLRALTSIQIRAEKVMGNKVHRLRGALWAKGIEGDERLLSEAEKTGQSAESDSENTAYQWESMVFSYAPGPWFEDAEWRRYHKFMGKVGLGLLRLGSREEWPILIGGLLAILLRNNRYNVFRVRAGVILQNLGLAQTSDAKRRSKQNLIRFEKAMDRLCDAEIDVFQEWRFVGCDLIEPDMDDANSLTDYGQSEIYPPGDWRNWMVEITPVTNHDRVRLQNQRERKRALKAKSLAQKSPKSAQVAHNDEGENDSDGENNKSQISLPLFDADS